MKPWTTTLALLLSTIAPSGAASDFQMIEFEGDDCSGHIRKAHVGLKPEYEQIKLKPETNTIYATTTNDGIYRWYAFTSTTENGFECAGNVLGRVWPGCKRLREWHPQRARCVRWCSLWADEGDAMACVGIGEG
ncbi:uncharacterized protein GGS25DRAFT_253019 [Hypoxylon fragiforme]|uniref:uncharacterized protein n=1 Tax=Hypoxylon fragiforme TaxID=63214 RepID=UPI0020C5D078|nr:uncharacterized protein GGS25DRAFT_253019 [Hypoxylon fragiforme]KAI2610226.1 hypothetical protein GGS25DRAFT_253019 [Hypoxylon fragiforme]